MLSQDKKKINVVGKASGGTKRGQCWGGQKPQTKGSFILLHRTGERGSTENIIKLSTGQLKSGGNKGNKNEPILFTTPEAGERKRGGRGKLWAHDHSCKKGKDVT